MRPLMSWIVAKLALPMTRLSIMRPAMVAFTAFGSISSLDFSSQAWCKSAARCSRGKSFGNATPRLRSSASLARRSAMIWFSSSFVVILSAQDDTLNALLEARADEIIEFAVEHPLRVAFLHAGAQVLDARLVEHVAADLVPPLDVGLGGFELVPVGLELAQLQLVQARFQHRHGFRAVAVLRAIILALYHDARRQMRDAHRRVGLVDVLASGSRCAVGVDAQIGGIDLDLYVLVDLGIHEHAREGGVAARVRIERGLAHQAVNAVLGAQVPVGVAAADLERGALDAGDLARRLLEHLHAVALAVAVLRVHALEHLRPVLRLGAARSRLDVHEAVVRIQGIGKHAAELEIADLLVQLRDVL